MYINCKYVNLNKELQIISGDTANLNIRDVGKRFRLMYSVVEQFNSLFGWHIQYLVFLFIVSALSFFNWILFGSTKTIPELLVYLFGMIYLLTGVSVLIIQSHKAKSSAKKIVQTSLRLQHHLPQYSPTREELFRLCEKAAMFEPTFTAADFFVLDKSTILSILSTITTYFIVVVQFNNIHLQS
ncbi:gustatory and pheromone receptor 32a-like [Aethina tumida]|uniref:gustatory and pheromone receptor 32a-like n=1 Tax=Aethina tumida TaxID=116153 RepID=UPI0021478CEF|nr:gustatory and pheromone receptor 32a-like [Aethina tumida]